MGLQKIDIPKALLSEIEIAYFWEYPIEGIEEKEKSWHIFFRPENAEIIQSFLKNKSIPNVVTETLTEQNWNATWEENYPPVLVNNVAHILAPFHKKSTQILPQIIINPSMAFGTGHHETTSGLLELMNGLDFQNRTLLDMGCGSGVLGIFSEIKGAKEVLLVDNDQNCVENTNQNIRLNKCHNSKVILGTIENIKDQKFDFIVSNITKNVNLQFLADFDIMLKENGVLIISGFLIEDKQEILNKSKKYDFSLQNEFEKNNWCGLQFGR